MAWPPCGRPACLLDGPGEGPPCSLADVFASFGRSWLLPWVALLGLWFCVVVVFCVGVLLCCLYVCLCMSCMSVGAGVCACGLCMSCCVYVYLCMLCCVYVYLLCRLYVCLCMLCCVYVYLCMLCCVCVFVYLCLGVGPWFLPRFLDTGTDRFVLPPVGLASPVQSFLSVVGVGLSVGWPSEAGPS